LADGQQIRRFVLAITSFALDPGTPCLSRGWERAMQTVQTVLGFWDFFWIGFVVMFFGGGTNTSCAMAKRSER